MSSLRRSLVGVGAAFVVMAALCAVMLAVRPHLGTATAALVLVVPVVVAAVVGGFVSGAVVAVSGALAYDLLFIPPYYRLAVATPHDWVALGVYLAVTVLVARLVTRLDAAVADARRREDDLRQLFEVTDLLVGDQALPELLDVIVSTLREIFGLRSVALMLPTRGRLTVAAASGEPLGPDALRRIAPGPGVTATLSGDFSIAGDSAHTVVLTANGRPVGLLGLFGTFSSSDRALVLTFANHLALSIERAQLREQALRTELLEKVDRLHKALVGAVSHDLRTPLATIKASASTLRDPQAMVGPEQDAELLELIEEQADRLNRLVTNLLDVSRVQTGALELQPEAIAVSDLVAEACRSLDPNTSRRVTCDIDAELPLVAADHVLIGQVLSNLFDNAGRYAPPGTSVVVAAHQRHDGKVEISVTDEGPGVAPDARSEVFVLFARRGPAAGTGVGLAIAKAFVEAHGESIWVEDGERGARFCFTLSSFGAQSPYAELSPIDVAVPVA